MHEMLIQNKGKNKMFIIKHIVINYNSSQVITI